MNDSRYAGTAALAALVLVSGCAGPAERLRGAGRP
jgi:hypothetical protein